MEVDGEQCDNETIKRRGEEEKKWCGRRFKRAQDLNVVQ